MMLGVLFVFEILIYYGVSVQNQADLRTRRSRTTFVSQSSRKWKLVFANSRLQFVAEYSPTWIAPPYVNLTFITCELFQNSSPSFDRICCLFSWFDEIAPELTGSAKMVPTQSCKVEKHFFILQTGETILSAAKLVSVESALFFQTFRWSLQLLPQRLVSQKILTQIRMVDRTTALLHYL